MLTEKQFATLAKEAQQARAAVTKAEAVSTHRNPAKAALAAARLEKLREQANSYSERLADEARRIVEDEDAAAVIDAWPDSDEAKAEEQV